MRNGGVEFVTSRVEQVVYIVLVKGTGSSDRSGIADRVWCVFDRVFLSVHLELHLQHLYLVRDDDVCESMLRLLQAANEV